MRWFLNNQHQGGVLHNEEEVVVGKRGLTLFVHLGSLRTYAILTKEGEGGLLFDSSCRTEPPASEADMPARLEEVVAAISSFLCVITKWCLSCILFPPKSATPMFPPILTTAVLFLPANHFFCAYPTYTAFIKG